MVMVYDEWRYLTILILLDVGIYQVLEGDSNRSEIEYSETSLLLDRENNISGSGGNFLERGEVCNMSSDESSRQIKGVILDVCCSL